MAKKVLVAGAGPVGLAAANELARLGAEVRIVDKTERPSPYSKAVAVNVRSLELLEPSGVAERMIAAGRRIRGAHFGYEGRRLGSIDLTKVDHRYNFLLCLPQDASERVLAEALAERGVTVERQSELVSFAQDGSGVEAVLRRPHGEETVRADYLLGCDGSRSTVRTALQIPFIGERYEQHCELADVLIDWPLEREDVHVLMRASGVLVFAVGLLGDRVRLISTAPGLFDLLPAGAVVREVFWQSDFRLAIRQAERYQDGRVFLAGDAAHVHSPAGGRGMNLGIWDGVAFARRLATGTLDGYTGERHPVGERILRDTDFMFRMTGLRNPATRTIRNLALRHLVPLEVVQRRIRPRLLGLAEPVETPAA